MRRYYFHFDGSRPHVDDTGEILKNDEAAWAAALRLARDVEHGLRPGADWTLRVVNETRPVFILTMTTKRC
jgi:hypothetical protein